MLVPLQHYSLVIKSLKAKGHPKGLPTREALKSFLLGRV
ncbi:hypothetical protein SLEP1_g31611 [Rubroshorea leprosula]|uniref:Uncharacterized protein n=1 Tax=Rubroshorea leprosula TaxID=152421 RepID=A0AAV5KB97_9ROSI|nr:hypothetical protein SLEP1_g31611 [Rubroshorea leprosula]